MKIFQGDCLEIMKTIEPKSIDMVLCDLPYGMTACAWDCPINLNELWNLYNIVCKDNAAMVFTASQPFTTSLISSNIHNFRYELIWEKPQGTNPMSASIMPLKAHENILVFYKKLPVYNPQMGQGKPYKGFSSKTEKIGEVYGDLKSTHRNNDKGTRFPKSVLRFQQERQGLHPTQKPVKLLEFLIKTYTNLGDTVLDNCMGSGSTGVACINTDRNFYGIELEQKYFDIANERLSKVEKEQETNILDFFEF